MKFEAFKYLWTQGIAKTAQNVMDEIPDVLRKDYAVTLDISDSMCRKLYEQYDSIRKEVRDKYFNTGNNDENKIDGHKICACITGALLNVQMITYKMDKGQVPVQIVLSNYALAFLSAISVLYLFLLSDFAKEGKEEYYNKLKEQAAFLFPETNWGHDSYVLGRIKALALNDVYGNEYDVLGYADMLFWIEKYNIDKLCN